MVLAVLSVKIKSKQTDSEDEQDNYKRDEGKGAGRAALTTSAR